MTWDSKQRSPRRWVGPGFTQCAADFVCLFDERATENPGPAPESGVDSTASHISRSSVVLGACNGSSPGIRRRDSYRE
jgi:hypothetical protein